MIKTVVREHHWPPHIINGLYLDGADHFGLLYWDKDVRDSIKEIPKK